MALSIGSFAVALHGEPGGVKGARFGVDLSSVRSAPFNELIGIDEHALDFDAIFRELRELSLISGAPFLVGVIDIVKESPEARVVFRPEPKHLERHDAIILRGVIPTSTISKDGGTASSGRGVA